MSNTKHDAPGNNASSADSITRIAMWSGPRNVSTALMRSWENRADAFVTDEPFYAFYLANTDVDHPGREEIIANQSTDWTEVVNDCTSRIAADATVHYQKHMTQHMLDIISLDWLDRVNNIFLLRSPAEVVSSFSKVMPNLTPSDLGFEQQHRLYLHVKNHIDSNPLIINSKDLLLDPETVLTAICDRCGISFDKRMLSWPAGTRISDGIWAKHWYDNVERSTGFAPYRERSVNLDDAQQAIVDRCEPYYTELQQRAATF
jgi:hypothetical protein